MQGTPPPQQILIQPSKVAAKYGDGPEVWNQAPHQIPLNQGMAMGYYPATQATLALVLSILGIVACSIFTAIPGLILANGALQITNSTPNHPDAGIAKAAQVVGWIGIGLFTLTILIYAGMGLLFLATSGFM
jgi:hypothetical protein